MKKDKLIQKFNKQAKRYEQNLDNRTQSRWRKKLINQAKGKVLELGIGAGANFPYYNEQVEVIGVDFSSEMLKSARQAAIDYRINAKLLQRDVELVEFEPNSFDSIVSTLSLCTYKNPVEILNRMNSWCRNDGQILLLEHGISSNRFLKMSQNLTDPLYRRISGCHWNREIPILLEQSKLQVITSERYWSGMIHIIRARPGTEA